MSGKRARRLRKEREAHKDTNVSKSARHAAGIAAAAALTMGLVPGVALAAEGDAVADPAPQQEQTAGQESAAAGETPSETVAPEAKQETSPVAETATQQADSAVPVIKAPAQSTAVTLDVSAQEEQEPAPAAATEPTEDAAAKEKAPESAKTPESATDKAAGEPSNPVTSGVAGGKSSASDNDVAAEGKTSDRDSSASADAATPQGQEKTPEPETNAAPEAVASPEDQGDAGSAPVLANTQVRRAPEAPAGNDVEDPQIADIKKAFGGNAKVTLQEDGTYSIVLTENVNASCITVPDKQKWYVDLNGYTITGTSSDGMPTLLVKYKDSSLSIGGGTVKGVDNTSDAGDALRVTNGTLTVRDGTYLGGKASGNNGIGGCALSIYGAQTVTVTSGTLTGGYGAFAGGCGIYIQGTTTHLNLGQANVFSETYKDPAVTGGSSNKYAGNGLSIEEVGYVSIRSGNYLAGATSNPSTNGTNVHHYGWRSDTSNSWVDFNRHSKWQNKFNYYADDIGPNYFVGRGMIIVGDDANSNQDILSGHFGSIRVAGGNNQWHNFSDLLQNRSDLIMFDDEGNVVSVSNNMGSTTLSLHANISIVPTAVDADGNDVSDKLPANATFSYKVWLVSSGSAKRLSIGSHIVTNSGDQLFTGSYTVTKEDGAQETRSADDGIIVLYAGEQARLMTFNGTSEQQNMTLGMRFHVQQVEQADVNTPAIKRVGFRDGEGADHQFQLRFSRDTGATSAQVFANLYKLNRTLSYSYDGDFPAGMTAPTSQSAFDGDSLVVAPEPEAPRGYTFGGWVRKGSDETPDAAVAGGSSLTMPCSDVELVGMWTKLAERTLSYHYEGDDMPDGVQPPASQVGYAGETVSVAQPDAVRGWAFTGWRTADGTLAGEELTLPEGNVELVGSWEKLDPHAVTFAYEGDVPDGIEAPAAQSGYRGERIDLPAPKVPDGYRFLGWALADGTAAGDSLTLADADVALVGTWERLPEDAQPVDGTPTDEPASAQSIPPAHVLSAPRHMAVVNAVAPSEPAQATSQTASVRHAKADAALPQTGDSAPAAGGVAALLGGLALGASGLLKRKNRRQD